MSTGFVLNIPQEMTNRLEDADKKIEKLAKTSEDAQTRIVSAFKSINTHGIDAFINKLTEAQTKLANLGNTKVDFSANASIFSSLTSNARKAIDEVNNVVSAIGKIKTASGETGKMQNPFLGSGISEALAKLNAEIEQAKRNFSELQNQFTHLNVPAGDKSNLTNIQNEAQFLMEYIRVLEKEKNGLIAAKNALAEANKTLQQKDPFKAKVDDLSRESLEALRYKDSMQAMKEFYAEQDKEMKKAAKEAEADRKKREKEEKATAERIATYDSKARRERYKAYTSTYEGAMRTSDRAKTLLQEQQAIKNLEAARAKLNKTDSDYANKLRNLNQRILEHKNNIDKATAGSKNLQTQHRSLMDISGQLARRLALVFSVSQITGYVKKLIEVRGEFELQQRSLQAILQNKDEANRIWQQTVDLAVRSPFRVKELVSYTKQLAAYRIESDKLFETNKMLADISAGLGVDMQRLILAFGQVRSAAYLRGTELRQFTEAGIPILEQLAQYFTELEGRAVSVGDVFERVSKRMVSFADVEEIFKRMTSEGGTFYRMQEIQAETLKGMWSNLKDSVDIMIDSVGRANEDTLKGSLKFVKELVDNYKDLVDVIKAWTIALSPVITVTALSRVATSKLGMAIYGVATQTQWSFNILQKWEAGLVRITNKSAILGGTLKVLSKALAGLGIGAVIFGVGALVKGLSNAYLKATELSRANKRLKESWEGIFAEDSAELEKSASGYTDLIMRLREANEGSQDRKNIINRLNNEYGQYLDFVVDEKTTLDQLADSYDTVIKRMKEKASLATYEEGVAAIEREYTTALKNAREEFYDMFEGASVRIKGNKLGDTFKSIIPTKQDIDNIYALLQQKIETLNKDQMDSLAEQQQLIQGIVASYYGEEYFLSRDYADAIDLINILIERKEKEVELQKEIDARFKETLSSRKANLRYQEIENKYTLQKQQILAKNQVDEVLADIDKELGLVIDDINNLSDFDVKKILDALAKQFELNKIKLKFDFDLISEQKYNEERNKIIHWASATTKSINESITSQLGGIFSEEELSKVLVTEEKQAKGMASILKDIESAWKAQNETIAQQISLKSEGLVADEKLLERAIRMEELYRKVADILGIELKYTERLSEESRNAINAMLPEEYQISLEAAYGGIDSILKGLKDKETQHLNVIQQLNEQKKNGLPIDEERLKLAEEAYWWTKKTQDLLDPKAKTSISESKVGQINAKLEEKYQIDSIDRTKDEVTLLQEANTERQNAIAYLEQLKNQKAQGLTVSQADLDLAKKDVEQYTLLWKLLGGVEKKKTTSDNMLDERIKVVEDMNKAYKDLNKTLSKAESLEGAFAKYKDAFGKAYKGTSLLPKNFANMTAQQFIKEFNFTTEDGMVGFFDKLIAYAKKTSEKVDIELAKGDYIMETRLEIQKGEDQKLYDEIQEMFDQYDLSLELKSLGIPPKLGESLFGVKSSTLKELRESVTDAFMGVEFYNERIKDAGKLMEDTFNGNVDLLNRKLIPAQQLAAKGWKDVGDGLATVFSSSYSVNDASGKMVDILVTPILPDGTVMSEKELEEYISKNLEGAKDVLKADKKGIVIHAGVDMDEGMGEYLHSLQEVFYASDMLSEGQKKKFKDFLDKIADMEDKAAKERMKTYSKYLLEGMSERVKLKIEEMRKLKEIEESDEFTPAQKERIKEGVSKEARAEQQKQEWKDFQGTEMYTMMFEDLEHYGSAAIDALYKKLSELKTSLSDLPASEVKEIVGQIEKLENIQIERNPFESLKKYKDEVKNIGFSEEELQNMLMGQVNVEKQAQDIIDVINIIQQSIADGGEESKILQELTPEQLRSWEQAKNIQQQTGETLDGVVKRQKRIVEKSKEHQATIVGQQKAYKKLDKSQEAALKETEVWLNSVGDLFSASKELMESLGVESDSVAMTIADTGSSMVSLILSAVQFTLQLQAMGIAANSALGIIGWIAIALQAVAMVISAIFSAKDKALQKQVEDNLSTVEELQKRYDALEDSIDNAWDTASIREYNRELKTTTQSMINAQNAAIAAQSQRKRANKEGSDAYNELQDMKAELKELEAQLEESLADSFSKVTDGILDSVHDAAKEFTDAWWDAFVETGDGLSGLEENFNEMFLNLAKNQAAMQITGAFAERWKKDLEKYINTDDTELTKDEAKKWAEEVRRTFPELSAALEGYLGAFTDMIGETSGGKLSELQKGIQGVTEETAQVLEALLNSMRFYVADSNAKLTQLLNNMMEGETESPMLAELRAQTKWMRDIYNLINGMTATHPSGGRGIKTVM